MAYSTDANLYNVLPDADNYVDSSLTATTFYEAQRTWATQYIDDRIKNHTATPSSEDLSEVEAYLVAYRLLRQNFASQDHDASRAFYLQYKLDADEMLEQHQFPATYSTPVKMHDFHSYAGTGDISLTVFSEHTYDALWVVKCTTAGAADSVWEIWNNVEQITWSYDLAEDDQFPDQSHRQGAAPVSLVKAIQLTITSDVSNEFAQGNTWTFRTYSRWRANQVVGFGSIPIVRG